MGEFTRKFLANYTILVAGDLAAKVLLLWASVRMARVLGTGLFGDVAFAIAFTSYFSLLVGQGLGTYGMQEVARDPARVREYAGRILALRLTASIVAATALFLTVNWLGKSPEISTLLLLNGLMFFSSAFYLGWIFQAMEEMKFVAGAAVLSQLVFSTCILTFLNRPSQYAWIPIFQFGGELLAGLFLYFCYFRKFGLVRLTFNLRAWTALLKESLPIGISAALSMVLFNFDIVLLGFMKPPAEVGQYSAAYKFVNFFAAFIMLYNTNILPAISRCRNNPSLLVRIADRSLKYTLMLAIPLAVGGAFTARPLMLWIFGSEFVRGAGALRILFWLIPILASRGIFRATLLSHGFQKDYLWIAMAAAMSVTGLNLVLIPRYSFLGAAATTITGEVLVHFLVYRKVARQVARLPLGAHVWKPVVACIPMIAFLLWYQGSGLPFLIAGGFLVYMAAGWITGLIRPREIWSEIHPPDNALHVDAEDARNRL